MVVDSTDKKILFELDKNARSSTKDIAKNLKLKKDTVAYRIRQLEKDEIITGSYTLIDYSKLGYKVIRVYLKLQNTTPEIEKDILKNFVDLKFSFTVYSIEGNYDIAVGFLVKNNQEFYDTYNSIKIKYKKYIIKEKVSIFLKYVHYYKNYLVDEKLRDYTSLETGNNPITNTDNTDLEILKHISQNAKFSLLDLSNSLELTSMGIKYRIKQLEKKGIILGYRIIIDINKLDYCYYKIDLELEDLSKLKKIQQFIKQHPSVIYEDVVICGEELEFDIEIDKSESIYKILDEIKTNFPGVIRTYSYYKARKIYKYLYFVE